MWRWRFSARCRAGSGPALDESLFLLQAAVFRKLCQLRLLGNHIPIKAFIHLDGFVSADARWDFLCGHTADFKTFHHRIHISSGKPVTLTRDRVARKDDRVTVLYADIGIGNFRKNRGKHGETPEPNPQLGFRPGNNNTSAYTSAAASARPTD